MGKTKTSAGTTARATAEYKVKKLTPRRIKMISEFLTATIDSPNNVAGFFPSGAWMDKLIEFLREPKRCKSTKMDILAWLKERCFQEVIGQINYAAARRMGSSGIFQAGPMEQAINLVKVEPTEIMGAIKTEMAAVKDEEAEGQDGFENDGIPEYDWGPVDIKEEIEMVTVKEELILEDENLPQENGLLMGDGNAENQVPKKAEVLENNREFDRNFQREVEALMRELRDETHKEEESDSSPDDSDSDSPASSLACGGAGGSEPEQGPAEEPQPNEQRYFFPGGSGRRVSNELFRNLTDACIRMAQEQLLRNNHSRDWQTVINALDIVKKHLV